MALTGETRRLFIFSVLGVTVPILMLLFAVDFFQPESKGGLTLVAAFLGATLWAASVFNATVGRVTLSTIGMLALLAAFYTASVATLHNLAPDTGLPPAPLMRNVNLGKCEFIPEIKGCPGFSGFIGAGSRGHACAADQISSFNSTIGHLSIGAMSDSIEAFMRIMQLAGQLYQTVRALE